MRTIDAFYEDAHAKAGLAIANYWLIFFAMGIANSGDATELASMNFILSNEQFKAEILDGDVAGKGSFLAGAIFAGMLIGGLVTGSFGDHVGRRPVLLLGLSMNTLSGFGAALAPGFGTFCLCRLGSGLGIGAILASLVTLAAESSPPSTRGLYVTVVSSFWTVGSISVAVMALVMFSVNDVLWRFFVAFSALPCLIGGVLVYLFVPESARYLASQSRFEEAAKEANRIASAMGFNGPKLEVDEVRHHFIRKIMKTNEKKGPFLTEMKKNTISALKGIFALYSPTLRKMTIALQILWFAMSFGSGLCTWMNTIFQQIGMSNEYEESLYFAFANIPGIVVAGFLMDRMGRKLLLLSSMILSSMSLLLFARASKSHETIEITLSACAFHAFLVSSWCAINVLTSELFPTSLRSTGLGVCAATGRVGSLMVQYINGHLIEYPDILLTVSSGVLLFGSFSLMFIQEMSNQPLRDTVIQSDERNEETDLVFTNPLRTESPVLEMT